MRPLSDYATWIFDCDGVILDSNRIKTDAFRQVALRYGTAQAGRLADYNRLYGGISRYAKFDYFFRTILDRAPAEAEMADVLASFAAVVQSGLRGCPQDFGFEDLMVALPRVSKFVVSGGAQDELRKIFCERGIARFFTAIFGSPDTKREILEREIKVGAIRSPAVFVGDARLDYDAAATAGLDFIFVTHWTEFDGWQAFFDGKDVRVVTDLGKLAGMLKGG